MIELVEESNKMSFDDESQIKDIYDTDQQIKLVFLVY
jgi:hypothetical protein